MIDFRKYTDIELGEVVIGILKRYPRGLTMPRIMSIIGRKNAGCGHYTLSILMKKLIIEKKVRGIDYGGVSLYKVNQK